MISSKSRDKEKTIEDIPQETITYYSWPECCQFCAFEGCRKGLKVGHKWMVDEVEYRSCANFY